MYKVYIMSISHFLKNRGFETFEGYSQEVPQQVEDLILLVNERKPLRVMEIGFNAGHSAEIFLKNNTQLTLTSFDLGVHPYVKKAKEFIDFMYPGRHSLILGDSRTSLPMFVDANKDAKFDVIFIDGGHEYDIVKSDMENCVRLAHKDTVIIMDDTMFKEEWVGGHTIGPTTIWTEYLQNHLIVELGRKDYCKDRGMCWGKCVF